MCKDTKHERDTNNGPSRGHIERNGLSLDIGFPSLTGAHRSRLPFIGRLRGAGNRKQQQRQTICEFFMTSKPEDVRQYLGNVWKVTKGCACCGNTPMHLAIRMQSRWIADILQCHTRFDLFNAKNHKGERPLHLGCSTDNLKMVEYLLNHNSNPNLPDNEGNTPLHLACRTGNIAVVECLLGHKSNPNLPDKHGNTPLHISVANYRMKITELLLNNGALCNLSFNPATPPVLYLAIAKGSYFMVELLLKRGANVNKRHRDGTTPLLLAVELADTAMVKRLLDAKANLDLWYGTNKRTILHVASGLDRKMCVKMLLMAGAKLNAVDANLMTALHLATAMAHPATVQLLLTFGSDVDARDQWQRSALHLAVLGNRARMVMCLLGNGASTRDINGPLLKAVKRGYGDVVRILVLHGAVLNLQNHRLWSKETYLQAAVRKGDYRMVRCMLNKGANVEVVSKDNGPIISDAICQRNIEIVRLLLSNKADVHSWDDKERSPLAYAYRVNDREIMQLLLATGNKEVVHEDWIIAMCDVVDEPQQKNKVEKSILYPDQVFAKLEVELMKICDVDTVVPRYSPAG